MDIGPEWEIREEPPAGNIPRRGSPVNHPALAPLAANG